MLKTIEERRSIRKFTTEPVDDETIDRILTMGAWAPSGLNNQPWRFFVVRDTGLKNSLAAQTKYSRVVEGAPVCIAVFLDNGTSYDRVKDLQAVGACLQNMLLAVHAMGLGAVWLGEILRNRAAVERLLGVPETCELMAVVALGKPAEEKGRGSRKPLAELLIGRR